MTGRELQYPELRGVRVLVVDDDADNREMLATILEHSGALVATADSAAEALSAFGRAPPQVLVTDIGLPDEDGFSLLLKVRALPAEHGGDIPAIALTGYGLPDQRSPAGADGFQAHLTKPVAPDEVLAAIARVLRLRP